MEFRIRRNQSNCNALQYKKLIKYLAEFGFKICMWSSSNFDRILKLGAKPVDIILFVSKLNSMFDTYDFD